MKATEFFDDDDDASFEQELNDENFLEIENLNLLDINLKPKETNNPTITKAEEKNVEYYLSLIKKNMGLNFRNPLEILKEMQENSIELTIDIYNVLLYNALNNKCNEAFFKLKDIIFDTAEAKEQTQLEDLMIEAKLQATEVDTKEIKVKTDEREVVHPKPNHITMIILLKYERFKAKGQLKKIPDNYFTCPSQENSPLKQEIFNNFDKQFAHIKEIFLPFGIKPNLQVENTILDILLEQKRFLTAWDYFQTFRTIADHYTYSSILKGIQVTYGLGIEWLDKAFEIMKEGEEKFIQQEEIFFNTLLDICIKFNSIDKAEKLFFDMREIKENLSEHTYSIMIKAYGRVKNLDKAIYMFEEIKNNFEYPSNITYGCMMNVYVKCGHTDLAKELMIEMDGKGIKQNLHTYSTLINGYRLDRNCGSALAVFDRAIKEKEQNIVIYNAILDCCIQCEEYKKMKEIFSYLNENSRKDPKFPQPDLITYSIVMKGVARTNDVERVLEVYTYLLERKDLKPDKYFYNIIMDFFAKNKDEKNVLMVYNDMIENKVNIEIVTYGVLIKLYCNLNNCSKVLELYYELLKKNMKPNVVVLQLVLKVLFKNRSNSDKAIAIFKNLKINNIDIALDSIIYELVITNCLRVRKFEDAFEFYVKALVDDNIEFNEDLSYYIIEAVIYNEKFDRNKKKGILKKFIKEFQDKKLTWDNDSEAMINEFLNDTNTDKKYEKESKVAKKAKNIDHNGSTNNKNQTIENNNQYYKAQKQPYQVNSTNQTNSTNSTSKKVFVHNNENDYNYDYNTYNNNYDYDHDKYNKNYSNKTKTEAEQPYLTAYVNHTNKKSKNKEYNHKEYNIKNKNEEYTYSNDTNKFSKTNNKFTHSNENHKNYNQNKLHDNHQATHYNQHEKYNQNFNQSHQHNSNSYNHTLEARNKPIYNNNTYYDKNYEHPNNKKQEDVYYNKYYEKYDQYDNNKSYFNDSNNRFNNTNTINDKKKNKFESPSIQFNPSIKFDTTIKPFNENETKFYVDSNTYTQIQKNPYNNNQYNNQYNQYNNQYNNQNGQGSQSNHHQNNYKDYNTKYNKKVIHKVHYEHVPNDKNNKYYVEEERKQFYY